MKDPNNRVAASPTGELVKIKMTKMQVIGQIVVAVLGFLGIAAGVIAQIKTGNTDSTLDEQVIPSIRKSVDELRTDIKTLVGTVIELRERVARLEGLAERGPGGPGWFPRVGSAVAGARPKPEAAKKLDKILTKKPVEIPMMQKAK